MFTTRLFRFLRKKIVLAVLFSLSFFYCLLHWLPESDDVLSDDTVVQPLHLPVQSFHWHSGDKPGQNGNGTKITSCRNSVQGKILIADDKGYVCLRQNVLSNGCCNAEVLTTKRYHCESCQDNGCCSIYEYCISCCLQPEKKALLQKILGKASETFNILFASITDHFELCLTKCRTSSQAESKACALLKKKLEKEELSASQWSSAMRLLGKEIAEKHFLSRSADLSVLDKTKEERKRDKKTVDVKHVMTNILETAASKDGKGKKLKFSEYNTFLQDTRRVVKSNSIPSHKKSKSKKNRKGKASSDLWSKILSYDPLLITDLCIRLQRESAFIPSDVRLAIWTECLLAKEKSKLQGIENFQKAKRKMSQLQSRETHSGSLRFTNPFSDVSTYIEKAFKESSPLKQNYSDHTAHQTSKILKLYNMYSKKIRQNYAFWAVPIQQAAFSRKTTTSSDDEDDSEEDDVCTAAVILEKTLRLCMLRNEQLFELSSEVIDSLKQFDEDFASHLQKAICVDVPSVIKDFPGEILTLNRTMTSTNLEKQVDLPIFIRKWLHEGFVSVLSNSAVYFAWDQLFLNGWNMHSLQTMCLVLLGLLKPWFMVAKNYQDVRHVFLEEPSKLYTLDIKRAWCHLQKNGNFRDVYAMNRNIQTGADPLPPKAVTPPPPPVAAAAVPVPSPSPPPAPSPPKRTPRAFIPWVPYDKVQAKSLMPSKTKVDLPFDLYIDAVRFVPDNATVVKVTGKILNMYIGRRDSSARFETYPDMDSPWRYPQFDFKQAVNKQSLPMNPDVVIMFRIYTVEHHTKKPMVLGSCLFCPFSNKDGKQAMLRVGGHQIRLRHGVPDPDFTVEHMLASHMDNNPVIPGLTILIRVLPMEQDSLPAPEYESHAYRSKYCKPNESEERLYKHYQDSENLNLSVRDVALKCCGLASVNDETLLRSVKSLFEKGGSQIEDFAYERYVNYKKENGVMVLADKATGLPIFLEGRYLQCLVQFFPGEDTKVGDGHSQVISFMTEELDLESKQRAPDWSDRPTTIYPEYDDRAYLLVALYGLRPRYDPESGRLVDKDGNTPRIQLKNCIAWGVVPCFNKGAVFAGSHIVPLLKGLPPDNVKEKLGYLPFDYICKKFQTLVKLFDTASIEVTIWDGIFSNEQCPPLPTHTEYLNASPNPRKYLAAREQKFGATIVELLRKGMLKPGRYTEHEAKIVKLLQKTLKENLNRALEDAGFSKLL